MDLIQKIKQLGKELGKTAQTVSDVSYKNTLLKLSKEMSNAEYDWDCYGIFVDCIDALESHKLKGETEAYQLAVRKMENIFDDKYVAYGYYPNGKSGDLQITIHGIGNTERNARANAGRYSTFSDYGRTEVAKCSKAVRNSVYKYGGGRDYKKGEDGVIYLANEDVKEMKGHKTHRPQKKQNPYSYLQNSVRKMF